MTGTLLIDWYHKELVLRLRNSWLTLQGGIEEMVGQQNATVGTPEDSVDDVKALRRLTELV